MLSSLDKIPQPDQLWSFFILYKGSIPRRLRRDSCLNLYMLLDIPLLPCIVAQATLESDTPSARGGVVHFLRNLSSTRFKRLFCGSVGSPDFSWNGFSIGRFSMTRMLS